MFFAGLNYSPTDRPEHFAHANTAVRLSAVWLAAEAFTAEERAFEALGLTIRSSAPEFPFRPEARAVAVADGSVYLLPGSDARPLRRVVGVTIEVRDLAKAAARLEAVGVPFRTPRHAVRPPKSAARSSRRLRHLVGAAGNLINPINLINLPNL